jgi:trans-2,3-dihydro-3-hydroxyanthranilate isomerase
MKKIAFYIVDVFSRGKYTGNQLAVFRSGKSLSPGQMQKIAKEMNYSETTFILSESKRNNGYDVRIFTPKREVPFAGHPTLGTAYLIQQEIAKKSIDKIILNLKVGQIPVAFSYKGNEPNMLWMKQKPPVFGKCFDSSAVARALNLDKKDMDNRFPVQEVSTGLPFMIAPLKTLSAVKRARTDLDKFFRLARNAQAKGALVFSPQTYEKGNDLNARVFADYYGVPEDPATGSANGCLAGYLAKHCYFGRTDINIKVEQGYEIGRPSLLFLKTQQNKKEINVFVGGKAVIVAKGQLV